MLKVALTRFKATLSPFCGTQENFHGIQEVRGSIPRSSTISL